MCLEAAGRDRPRKRVARPESYCMSVDIAGPFHDGVDAELKKVKYVLVATMTLPCRDGQVMVEGLKDMGYRNPAAAEARGELDKAELEYEAEELEEQQDPLHEIAEDKWKWASGARDRHHQGSCEDLNAELSSTARVLANGIPSSS